jgi:hypothetical protein
VTGELDTDKEARTEEQFGDVTEFPKRKLVSYNGY